MNDFSTITIKDDVVAGLIYLGYLGYDDEWKIVSVPNHEALLALKKML